MKNTNYYLHTISGLHVGTGQGIGVIDMPIARERASNLPLVPGSGIKGVLRNECQVPKPSKEASEEDKANFIDYLALFGPEAGNDASEFAGALAVGDAHLLCLPIRSWKGTFSWVTCPMILQRYKRDLKQKEKHIPEVKDTQALHADETVLCEGEGENANIYLEDLDLSAKKGAQNWADFIAKEIFKDDEEWKVLFKQRFLIVADNVFDFLSETATEIRARIKIEENTRTVKSGALWYEEYLPAETILWGELATDRAKNKSTKKPEELLKLLPATDTRIQIGGNATIGAGQVRWIMGEV